jgi:predicted DNA-binding transcriptional regulator YafY
VSEPPQEDLTVPPCDNRSERCIRLLLHLWEHGRVSTAEAARLVDTTPRRARADLDLLARFLPIEAHGKGRLRYWLLEPEFGTRNLAVLDRISLLVGKELTSFLRGTALHEGFWRVEGALREGVSPRFARHLERKFFHLAEPARAYDERAEELDTLLDALLRERRLHLVHQAPGRDPHEHRDLEPLTLVIYRRALHLLARRPDGIVRRYAVDRVIKATLGEPFSYPEAWDPGAELAPGFGIHADGTPEHVVLRFTSQAAAYARVRTWHHSQRQVELSDGGLELHMVTCGRELVRFVLEWGAGCRAVEPPWLVEAVRRDLEGALGGYQETTAPAGSEA